MESEIGDANTHIFICGWSENLLISISAMRNLL